MWTRPRSWLPVTSRQKMPCLPGNLLEPTSVPTSLPSKLQMALCGLVQAIAFHDAAKWRTVLMNANPPPPTPAQEVFLSPTAVSYNMVQLSASTEYSIRLQALAGPKRSRVVTTFLTTSRFCFQSVTEKWDMPFLTSAPLTLCLQLECCTDTPETVRRLCWTEMPHPACTPSTWVEMRSSRCKSTATWAQMEAAGS